MDSVPCQATFPSTHICPTWHMIHVGAPEPQHPDLVGREPNGVPTKPPDFRSRQQVGGTPVACPGRQHSTRKSGGVWGVGNGCVECQGGVGWG